MWRFLSRPNRLAKTWLLSIHNRPHSDTWSTLAKHTAASYLHWHANKSTHYRSKIPSSGICFLSRNVDLSLNQNIITRTQVLKSTTISVTICLLTSNVNNLILRLPHKKITTVVAYKDMLLSFSKSPEHMLKIRSTLIIPHT